MREDGVEKEASGYGKGAVRPLPISAELLRDTASKEP
jgi:hypothetical protein